MASVCAMTSDQLEALGQRADNLFKSPVVLDLDGDKVLSISVDKQVLFDHEGHGELRATGWVDPGDALLVRDLNGNGLIDNGTELFGTGTRLDNGKPATNGYAALHRLDTNRDGTLNNLDAAFDQLQLWLDKNSNGHTEARELHSLSYEGIVAVSLKASASTRVDAGNRVALLSSYTTASGDTGLMADVWFRTKSAPEIKLVGTLDDAG